VFGFELIRREITQGLVNAHGIVESFDVFEHGQARLGEIRVGLVVGLFVFQRPEDAFHHRVIVAAVPAAHGALNAQGAQRLLVNVARVLGAIKRDRSNFQDRRHRFVFSAARGRSVDSRPSRFAMTRVQASPPYGWPRCRLRRIAASSASFWG